jgi:hypothetical protein
MMNTPSFYAEAPGLVLRDPLAEFLGAADQGIVEYGYLDAVKLAGHSCPTVAGAYLMTRRALASLYGEVLPERGAIKVELRDGQADGVTGVIANVVGLLTGAAQSGGFKGIAGKFDRRNLLHFNTDISGDMRFTRLDTGASVVVSYHPEIVPPSPAMKELMQKTMMGVASDAERLEFGRLWQERVARILLEHGDDPELVTLTGA